VARSIWNGALSFAGIDVPVKVFGAADPQGVQFRELHEPDGAEIAHELVDADGRKVDRPSGGQGLRGAIGRVRRARRR
jgi:non-homologous end joining protein Ku